MIILPFDEADREAVLEFLLPELLRNGALIADCTVLRDDARVFVAQKGDAILGVMAQIGLCVGLRCTSENAFRKLLAAHGGGIASGPHWSIVHEEELRLIESQATIEWTDPMHEMVYAPIAEGFEPRAPETLAHKLTVADLGSMRRLFEELEVQHFEAAMLRRGPFYGIVEDERLVAVAGSYYVTDWLGELGLVHVVPRYRRRGYGTLVSHLVTQDILARSKKACLHVAKKDRGPHELYVKMGYRDVGDAHLVVWRV